MGSSGLSLTLIIIVVTVGISFYAWNNLAVYNKLMMNPYQMFNYKQYWRAITSGFIHSGYVHLGFNMFTLYFFGGNVELLFNQILGVDKGKIIFIVFYLSAIIISDLPVAYRNRNNPGYNSLGASGAVSALVFSSILFFPLVKICLFGLLCLPGFILGALYIVYSYTQGKKMADNINHEAHLYGAIYGLAFSLILYPPAGAQFFEQILGFNIF